MQSNLLRLFSPVELGRRTAKNRIVSAAHNTNLDRRGLLSQAYADYIVRRAQGGPGIVTCFGAASVHEPCGSFQRRVSLWDAGNDRLLRQIADRAHREDCLVLSQAAHVGRRGDSNQTGLPLQAPSEIAEPVHREIPHVLSRNEISHIVDSFVGAAQRLERCGWDGIEITSYAGQLIEQFWSPKVNVRNDEYGGDLVGRMRFSVDVVQAVRAAVSPQFVISFRMTGDPGAASEELGLDAADMLEIAQRLGRLDCIDLFHISGSSGATREAHAGVVPPDTYARGCYLPLARSMKQVLEVPVLGTGRVLEAQQAEDALAQGDCDLVGMARALIADPDLPKKAESGRLTEVRPCISIITGCAGRTGRGNTLGCSVNPAIAYPQLELHPVPTRRRRVVVIGAGPAGLEAARVSALRGHDVVLLEKEATVGGQMVSAAQAPRREHLVAYVRWLDREIHRLKVDLHVRQESTVDTVIGLQPDVVVVGTGSASVVPPTSRPLQMAACSDVDILDGTVAVTPGSHVLVYDVEGGYRGGSVANMAAGSGAGRVELATPLGMICQELDKLQQPSMYRQLSANNVVWSPNQRLVDSEGSSVFLRNHWSEEERSLDDIDLVIFVGYRQARSQLYASLQDTDASFGIHQVGDCLAPRRLLDATADGVRAGNAV